MKQFSHGHAFDPPIFLTPEYAVVIGPPRRTLLSSDSSFHFDVDAGPPGSAAPFSLMEICCCPTGRLLVDPDGAAARKLETSFFR